jgi:pilus assembly protein CpaB
MLFRNALLAVGAILVCAGIGLSLFWLSQMGGTPSEVKQEPQRPVEVRRDAVLEAVHPLPSGTLIRSGDFRWREIDPSEVRPGIILRKETSENEYLGAIITRDFAEGEPLAAAGLVKTTDRRFLSAALKPGMRAVTIAVDAPQGSSGMVLPGDRVDVVLTQNLSGVASVANDPARKSVAETVLRNVRVIAVDQRLNMLQTKPTVPEAAPEKETVQKEPRMPRTATLELTETQAEKLLVAAQLGGLQLPVRALERGEDAPQAQEPARSTWASDVSPALKQISQEQAQAEAQQKAQTELLKAQAEQQKSQAKALEAEADERTSRAALLKADAALRQLEVALRHRQVLAESIGGTVVTCCVRTPPLVE